MLEVPCTCVVRRGSDVRVDGGLPHGGAAGAATPGASNEELSAPSSGATVASAIGLSGRSLLNLAYRRLMTVRRLETRNGPRRVTSP